MITLNFSRLNTWDTCRRMYRYQYIDRIPVPLTPSLFLANQIHKALHQYLSLDADGRRGHMLEDILRRNWQRHPQRGAVFADLLEEAEYGRRALVMLQKFLAGPDADARPRAVEQWFEIPLDDRVTINGKVDRIDDTGDGLVVVDYKTGRLWSREAVESGLQPLLYAFLVEEATGETVKEVIFYYINEEERISITEAPREDGWARLRDRLMVYADAIRQEREYPPEPGDFCQWCDYRERCTEGQEFVAGLEAAEAQASAAGPDLPF